MSYRFILGVLSGAVSSWALLAWGPMDAPERTYPFHSALFPVANSASFACRAVATTGVYESGLLEEQRSVKAISDRGSDKLSLRVDRAAHKLFMLTGADVSVGRIEANAMDIIVDDAHALVAVSPRDGFSSVTVIRLDKKTGNGLWSKTGDMMGIQTGWMHYLECR